MEKGILFSEPDSRPTERSVKQFSFGDILSDTLWEEEPMPDITHAQARELDRIGAWMMKKF